MRASFEQLILGLAARVGGTSPKAHRAALDRITQAGAKPISWVQLICESQRDWQRKKTAQEFANIFSVGGR